MASIYPWDQQQADFVHETCLEESAVDVAAAFQEQSADSEMLSELFCCFGEVDGRFARDDVRNSLFLEHSKVSFGSALAYHADKMITVEIGFCPTQFTEGINGNGVRPCASSHEDGPRTC